MKNRTIRLFALLLVGLLAWSLPACSDDADDNNNNQTTPDVSEEEDTFEPGDTSEGEDISEEEDTGQQEDTEQEEDTAEEGDTEQEDDTEQEEDTTEPPGDCDHQGFELVAADTFIYEGVLMFIGQNSADAPYDSLNFELADPAAIGSFDLAGQNYADCEHCVILWQGCDESMGNCAKTFFVSEGTLTVDSSGESGDMFAGKLSDVVLLESDIDDDFNATPVEGGESWCVSELEFEVEIQ